MDRHRQPLLLPRPQPRGGTAVDELDLTAPTGRITVLVGPSGCGKTTSLRMVNRMIEPTSGSIHLDGRDTADLEAAEMRRGIGYVIQHAGLFPHRTIVDNIGTVPALLGWGRQKVRDRSMELLERVGLEEAADRKVRGYSGGMKRRLDLALALVHGPQILFLDEPTTGLDPQSRSALWAEVSRLAREDGVTVFLTTQYLEEADVLADRIAIIDRGVLVAEGTPAQLKAEIGRPTAEVIPRNPGDRAAIQEVLNRFGEPAVSTQGAAVQVAKGPEGLTDIVRALDEAGLRIANIELHAPTLDDVFLAHTGTTIRDAEAGAGASMHPMAVRMRGR